MEAMKRKPRSVTEPRKPLGAVRTPKVPVRVLFRMFVLGSVAVIASAWAIWRHYSVPRVPMLQPVPTASEIPIEPSP
jgi:hypothetical protein